MLHLSCKDSVFIVLAILTLIFPGCKGDTPDTHEEEKAYLTDYEAPDHTWGFMDTTGKLVIKPTFDQVTSFREGLAAVNKKGKWGYINMDGMMVIEPQYKSAWAFHEGKARVETFDLQGYFIDYSGQVSASGAWQPADDFSGGFARIKTGSLYGFINSKGNIVIEPVYTRSSNFYNGLAIVEYEQRSGVIDTSGSWIIEPEFTRIRFSSEGTVILANDDHSGIAFNAQGKIIVSIPDAHVVDADHKLMSVRKGRKMYFVEMESGKLLTTSYVNIIYLGQNRWAGKQERDYFLLSNQAKRISANTYAQINRFSNGFAVYSRGRYWGYLDLSGRELTSDVFGLAWDYKEGLARAAFEEGIAFINSKQQLAFYPPAGTIEMRDFSAGLAPIQMIK